jgi:group I intron endonuclease
MQSGVYRITHAASGKHYIGSAINFAQRWRAHRSALARGRHHSRFLQRAWSKYGPDAFELAVLEQVEPATLIEREQFWIDTLDACGSGFNLAPRAGNSLGVVHTAETRAKFRAAKKGTKPSTEMLEAARRANLGQKRSPETKARIGESNKGKKQAPETVEARAAKLRGLALSDATRARMSESGKGRRQSGEHVRKRTAKRTATMAAKPYCPSPETRKKIGEAHRGKTLTAETKARMSAAQKGRIIPAETRARMSESAKGRKMAPDVIAKRSATRKKNAIPVAPETIAKRIATSARNARATSES